MSQEYWIEMSLQELQNVNRSLRILSLKAEPPILQVAGLIKQVQTEFGLLEALMRDSDDLLQAQIGLLEASVLAQQAKPGEAIRIAYSYLYLFLQSMGRVE